MKTASILVAIPMLALLASCPFALAHTGVSGTTPRVFAAHRMELRNQKSPAEPLAEIRKTTVRGATTGSVQRERRIWRPATETAPTTPEAPKLTIHPIIDVWLSPTSIARAGEPTIRIIPARLGSAYGIAAVGSF